MTGSPSPVFYSLAAPALSHNLECIEIYDHYRYRAGKADAEPLAEMLRLLLGLRRAIVVMRADLGPVLVALYELPKIEEIEIICHTVSIPAIPASLDKSSPSVRRLKLEARESMSGIPALLDHTMDSSSLSKIVLGESQVTHKSLADTCHLLNSSQLEYVLQQLVDVFVHLYSIDLDGLVGGGRRISGLIIKTDDKSIAAGQVLEETMWQTTLDLSEPNLKGFSTHQMVVSSPLETLIAISRRMSRIFSVPVFIIWHHLSVRFLKDMVEPVEKVVCIFIEDKPDWVKNLESEKGLKGRVWHRDLPFGNLLVDEEGTIHAFID
ncbi:hypothetical protein FRB97_008936 [Tulasnella sp. 331]|nr:hypothetical protein FRB97_008936 [Tulasnella sp. 331]